MQNTGFSGTNSRETCFQFICASKNYVTCTTKLTLILSLGVKAMWSSVSVCKSLHPGAKRHIPDATRTG